MRVFAKAGSPGAAAVGMVGVLAAAMATLMVAAVDAQVVSAPAGTATSMARDEFLASPEAEKEAPSWYLNGRPLMGATWATVATIDPDLGTQHRVSPFFRWNSRRRGWGPAFGFSATTTDLRAPVGTYRRFFSSASRPAKGWWVAVAAGFESEAAA